MKLLTTKEVAERLGVSVRRVHALIQAERLPAGKFGRDYMIREEDLKSVADRKPGRPPKTKTEIAAKAGKNRVGMK
ncbi:MAG TPA: helix-turn-helix domain-containing protein [Nitrososphaera sp.]|nr:helix-turn-helix domain-containing protein [Nitrososphaera sp.]